MPRVGTLEEILAQLKAQDSRLQELELENGRLRDQVADLKSQLEKVEREGKQQAAPFRKPRDQRKPPEEHKTPGQKPGHPASYKKPPADDQVQQTRQVAIGCCPDCGGALEGKQTHEHFVVDIPRIDPEWVRYQTESGHCDNCNQRKSSHHPDMPSRAVGAAGVTFGHNLVALATLLRTQSGMTFRKMSRLFKDWFGISISPAGLQKALARAENAFRPTYEQIAKNVKTSKKVHVDETGWWLAAESHWAWVAATSTCTLYVIAKSRGHEVAESLIGANYPGCLHSDFLNSYYPLNCKKSKCVSHLLATIDKLQRRRKTLDRDASFHFLARLKALLQDAIGLWHAKPKMESEPYQKQADWIQRRVDELLKRKPRDHDNLKLCRRIRKYREEIFRFLYDPDAEPTNNLAERELRPLVISRKLSGGNRSRRGADRTALLYSVYATLHRQGQNIVNAFLDALYGRRTILI